MNRISQRNNHTEKMFSRVSLSQFQECPVLSSKTPQNQQKAKGETKKEKGEENQQ
jgi:hypothetical protein